MIHEVVAQHAEMAAFLWELRGMAVASHHYTLVDLAELEDRIEAHLDGLRLAGEPAWEILLSALASKEPGAFFAAAVSTIEARDVPGFAAVLDATEEEAAPVDGIAGALAWAAPADALAMVKPMRTGEQPMTLTRLALGAAVAHRWEPGPLVDGALFGRHEELRAPALRAVGELGLADLAEELRGAWESDDAEQRFWSAWAGARHGLAGAAEVLWAIVRDSGPFAELAADCAARTSPPAEARRQIEAFATWPGLERACLSAAGALGDPALLPWVIDRMADVPLARLAGEAFSRITGAAIQGPLRAPPPPDHQPGPTDDPRDSNVKMDPDTQLSWPQAGSARALVAAQRGRLATGMRLVDGTPIDEVALGRVLRTGGQRRRAGAAFELGLRAPGRPLFDVTARAGRQAAKLGALA